MSVTLAAALRIDGADNTPGVKLKVMLNVADNITVFGTLPASPTTGVTRTTVATDFTASPAAIACEFIPTSGNIKSSKVGPLNKCEFEGEMFLPNGTSNTDALGLIRQLENSRVFGTFTLMNGVVKLMGESYDLPGKLAGVDWDSKKVGDDGTVSMIVKFEWFSQVPGGANFTGAF